MKTKPPEGQKTILYNFPNSTTDPKWTYCPTCPTPQVWLHPGLDLSHCCFPNIINKKNSCRSFWSHCWHVESTCSHCQFGSLLHYWWNVKLLIPMIYQQAGALRLNVQHWLNLSTIAFSTEYNVSQSGGSRTKLPTLCTIKGTNEFRHHWTRRLMHLFMIITIIV